MKSIITTAAVALSALSFANAEVQTYQGSTRWLATLFTPGIRTAASASSYTSYYILETSAGSVVNAIRIDAWATSAGRYYYVDDSFFAEYDYYGRYGTEIAGGMESDDISAIIPFRGSPRFGRLDSFVLYPTIDYYPNNGNLDISTITGSARYNAYFSGDIAHDTAINEVLDYLESRGYSQY
ncbi:MAG: hypothetical protein V4727_01235 [Verrucomicrobiota bacterium]